MRELQVTCESVTPGHPDKLCDQISDGLLDAYLSQDSRARVAVEVMASKNTLMIAGEVTADAQVNPEAVARRIVREIGYTNPDTGFDADRCLIFTNLNRQSPDIARGVDKAGEEHLGGGDQGIMYGYACNETLCALPLAAVLAHRLTERLTLVRQEGLLPWLLPDGKSQVTVRYDQAGKPAAVTSVVVSAQHKDIFPDMEQLRAAVLESVINEVIPSALTDRTTRIHINPTGRFVVGGPAGDTGLTGRKIMVDTYGGLARHGGGAFSGKDPTKVDRTAAYMCRYAAKNVVGAGLAARCEVSVAYVIGALQPEAVEVETFGTGLLPDELLSGIVQEVFPFGVAEMIRALDLRKPRFRQTAVFGHFGRELFPWEATDKADVLRSKALLAMSRQMRQPECQLPEQ